MTQLYWFKAAPGTYYLYGEPRVLNYDGHHLGRRHVGFARQTGEIAGRRLFTAQYHGGEIGNHIRTATGRTVQQAMKSLEGLLLDHQFCRENFK